MDFVHQEIGEDVQGLAGYYTPHKELRLKQNGREVLAVVGVSRVESACCGGGTCGYAIVPGYIVNWKYKKNNRGMAISQVEPIADEATRRQIASGIRESECIWNIDFW